MRGERERFFGGGETLPELATLGSGFDWADAVDAPTFLRDDDDASFCDFSSSFSVGDADDVLDVNSRDLLDVRDSSFFLAASLEAVAEGVRD